MKKFKERVDAIISMGEWLLFRGLLFFCLADEGRRFAWWVIHH
jgi:hypothetical protein